MPSTIEEAMVWCYVIATMSITLSLGFTLAFMMIVVTKLRRQRANYTLLLQLFEYEILAGNDLLEAQISERKKVLEIVIDHLLNMTKLTDKHELVNLEEYQQWQDDCKEIFEALNNELLGLDTVVKENNLRMANLKATIAEFQAKLDKKKAAELV